MTNIAKILNDQLESLTELQKKLVEDKKGFSSSQYIEYELWLADQILEKQGEINEIPKEKEIPEVNQISIEENGGVKPVEQE